MVLRDPATPPPCRSTPSFEHNGTTQYSSLPGQLRLQLSLKPCSRGENGCQREGLRWSRTSFRGWGLLWRSGATQTRSSIAHSGSNFNFIRRDNFVADRSQKEVWRCVRGEGVWEGRHVRRVPVGMSRFLEFQIRVHSSGVAVRVVDQ